jgi:hypothetical protein
MGCFFLARVSLMGCKGVIECLAIDILRVVRLMIAHRFRQVLILLIGHLSLRRTHPARDHAKYLPPLMGSVAPVMYPA